jgi:hypothetical protein
MAAKKVKEPSEEDKIKAGFILGYEVNWMKKVGKQHPDYEKVKKEAKKHKIW